MMFDLDQTQLRAKREELVNPAHIGGSKQASTATFSLFVALYVTGFMMEMVEAWKVPAWTGAGVVLSILTIAFAKRRSVFLAFLILTTAYFLLFRFPDVANHVNLLIFCNVFLIVGLAYSYLSRSGREDFPAFFDALLSPVRLMLIVTYMVAGFHKLNYDFLNPEVSCVRRFLNNLWLILTTHLFNDPLISGVPVLSILCVIGVVVVLMALPRRVDRLPRGLLLCGLVVIVGISTLVAADSLAAVVQRLTEPKINLLIMGIAGLVIFWQLIEGPLLLVPRLQAFFLCFAVLFHGYLSLIGFVDFQSLALALLLSFVPQPVLSAWNQQRGFRLGSLEFDRVYAYVGLNVLAGLLTGVNVRLSFFEPPQIIAMQGILFSGGVLILIWPLLFALLRRTRQWRWSGVSVFDSRTPKFLYVFPLLLLLFGMTPYFGLRTGGNFSMFSNLRTEGAVSNHIILKNNPLKFWDYQEDIVRVLKVDSSAVYMLTHNEDLNGQELPVVEFRKLVHAWAKNQTAIPIVFEYQGRVYASDNIAADPTWSPVRWDWEMFLLDFRVIQPKGPNGCRW